ncbi:MAG: pyridoxamine 5'-phosphate oxidase family protein [Methanotrichaceae archaeon]|nr:pyridoxamine 5'-phosphate oxidase family protein [Methanotrichaceae archaeon]
MHRSSQLQSLLRELFASQKFAALATEDGGKPHNCLVAFATTDDLRNLLFTTSRDSSKYRNILAESRVAILVDSRSNQDSDFRKAIAVTATGRAKEAKGKERERLLGIYLAKHPKLADFANVSENALIKVEITNYEIATFNNVRTFRPR